MIPLRDSLRSRRFPIITVTLILINFYVFWQELSLSDRALDKLVHHFGVIPAHTLQAMTHGEPIQAFIPLITAMFLHGGWLHLLGNMLYLWVFGDNIEDRMGRFRFLLFYLTVGVCGNIVHIWFDPTSTIPTIGASGAIAGILGAYFICFPRARILTLVPILIFISIIEIPAVFYLFLWFGLQLINGFIAFGMPGNIVAWWAHIGGFVAGVVLVKLFGKRKDFSYR